MAPAKDSPPPPYVGLRPFEFHEAALFYGRGEHIAEMVRTLRKGHFLAVVGSSGSGKSSLVRAGLLPAIAAGFMDGGEEDTDWRFAIMRPGLDPYGNLLRELLPQLAPGQTLDPTLVEFRRHTLRGGPRGLVEAVGDSLLPEATRLVVLVDQFEEIFRFLDRGGPVLSAEGDSLADRRNAALAFVDMLLTTAAERDSHVYIVLTMRSEYLGECEAFLGLSAAIAKSQFLTPRMTREQIKDIIERPIQAIGGRIDPQVVTDLLNSLGTAQDQLPRVEHLLLRMWDRACKIRKAHPDEKQALNFTPEDYRAVGRFETALDLHGEQLFWDLGPASETGQPSERQRIVEHLFRSLAVRSSQGTLVRRLSSLGEVASLAGAPEQAVADVVEHFRQPGCNFLVATPPTPLARNTTLDISHEALLRQWVKLGKWLDDEAESAADYCRLEDDARSWQKLEKGFLQPPELDIYLQQSQKWTSEWARRYGTDFALAMQYLKESKAQKERLDAEAEARRNELAAERARTAQEARKAARFRWIVAGLAMVLAIITTLATVAWIQSRKASRNSVIAWKQGIEARMNSIIATSVSIAARAYQLRDERLDTALLLATEAENLATQEKRDNLLPDPFGTLMTMAYYNPRLRTFLNGGKSPVNAVAFSPDGKQVATGDYTGDVALWDVETHQVIERHLKSDDSTRLADGAVRAITFSADGRHLAVSSNEIWLHSLSPDHRGNRRVSPEARVAQRLYYSLAFSSDSKLLACGDSKGNVVIRNLATDAEAIIHVESETAGSLPNKVKIRGLSFDGDARVLAAGCSDGRILIWKRQADEWVAEKDRDFVGEPTGKDGENYATKAPVQCLSVTSDGKYLAVGRNSGAVHLYDLSDHNPSPKPFGSGAHGGFITSLAFAPDSKHLISSGNDGTLRLWEVPKLKPVGQPFTGHVGRVFAVTFSHDSRIVASGGEDGSAILWDTKENVAETVRQETSGSEFSVAFTPDGVWEAYGYERGFWTDAKVSVRFRKRDDESGEKFQPAAAGERGVPLVAFSGDGKRLATTMPGGPLRVYALPKELPKDGSDWNPQLIKEIAISQVSANVPPNLVITAIGLSRDGSRVAAGFTAEGHQRAAVWGVSSGAKSNDLPGIAGIDEDILVIQFSPDGTRLVFGGGDTAVIWRVGEGSKASNTTLLTKHTGKIRSVAFSPDGKIFATASGDTTLILWDENGKPMAPPLTGHKQSVVTTAFSRDGKWLASGSTDHLVILWDVETGLIMGRLNGHTDTVRALAFEDDGEAPPKTLYSASFASQVHAGDGGMFKWDLDPAKLKEICRQRANRNLSESEWRVYIRTGKYRKTWNDLPIPEE